MHSDHTAIRLDAQLGKAAKKQQMFDILLSEHFEQTYDVPGVGFSNMTDLYSPAVTGIFDIFEQRQRLVNRGMP